MAPRPDGIGAISVMRGSNAVISPEQIPLPDELIVEEPNPYRRRQKVIGIRRSGGGRKARIVKACVLSLALPLVLLYGGYRAARRILSSPLFLIRPYQDVKVSGNRIVSLDDVLNVLGLGDDPESRPVSLFRVDLASDSRRLDSIPWIESATVTRVFPHRLVVAVTERTPIAYADADGRIGLVDKDGVFLQMLQKAPLDFPVLYGLDSAATGAQRKSMIARYEQFLSETRNETPGSGWTVSEADLSDPDDLRALLVQGRVTVLVHFGDHDYQQRFRTFMAVAPQVLANNPRIDSMDLRYRSQVVVDPAALPGVSDSKAQKSIPRAAARRASKRRRAGRRVRRPRRP